MLLCLAYTARGEEIEKDTAKIRNVELNEVVVQSFKQQRDLRLEPLSASAVTGTAIQNRNITGIKEFSSFIPNLFMPDYGSKLTSPVYIRGIGSKINAPSVGLYVDGIPYFEKSAFDFDFNEVDRIEVLRGPQGTLYGRNTMGGIINVYTKSPLKYEGTNVWLSNGSYGYRDYALSHYKKIGEKFGYAISGDYRNSDGYFTNLFTDKNFARQDMKQKMFSEELNIKSTTPGRYKWLFGAFGFWQGIDNTVTLDYFIKDYATRKLYDTPAYGVAFYHQSTIDDLLTRGLSLTFGIRYDYEHTSNDFLFYKETDGGSEQMDAFDSRLKFSQVTPKIALQYMFPSTGMLYATVTKGYKTGGFNTSFDREEDRTFRPETSWNYEFGAKHPFLDNRLNAEFCFFWIDWKNQQIYQMLATQNGQFLRNAGRSESKGVEVSLQGNPVNGLMVQVNYGFTHATFKDYKDERRGIDYSGNFLPMVPRHTFAVGADYTIPNPCRHIDRFTVSANYTGTGRILWKEDNKVSQPYYGLLNAKVSATKDFITFAIWAKNMTGADYSAFYFETGGKGLAQKGRPFTIGGNIQLSF